MQAPTFQIISSADLDRKTVSGTIAHYGDSRKRLEDSVNNLQESLDYLRICIKYQLFDLEATRRENKYLRKMLEENNENND